MRSRTHHRLLVAAVCCLAVTLHPREGSAQASGDAPQFTTGALELRLGGRLQTLFSTTTVDDARGARWDIRRARLELDVSAHPRVSGRLQGEFRIGEAMLRDAFLVLHLAPQAELLAGNAFRPFGLISQTSSRVILPIERGAVIRGLDPRPLDHHALLERLGYVDRDVGVHLRGELSPAPRRISYTVGLTNGPLDLEDAGRSPFQASARVRVQAAEQLHLAAAWSQRDFAGAVEGGSTVVPLRSGRAWELDLEYGGFSAGPHLMAEVAVGDADPFGGSRFTAAQLWLAYRTPAGDATGVQLEPLLRVSTATLDAGAVAGTAGTLLTPGLNLYLDPLNRIMLNYDVWRPRDGGGEQSLKLMLQMAF